MNHCILVAEVLQDPQLRYTSDTQLEVTEMLVQFEGQREGEPPSTLKVVAWGNLAKEVQQRYRQGDRVAIEGRLSMNTITRQEGFKEKRAELVAQKLYTWGSSEPALDGETSGSYSTPAPSTPSAVPTSVGVGAATSPATPTSVPQPAPTVPSPSAPSVPPEYNEPMEDDIPF
ncbi:MAG TPA: single-stranded DNA-binding protein [Oscillatoriales cyanobacterium M59_W2019_021]|nr:MAG: single-stranded DNA-binding protein [Cyanobacteria bacterium J055]HIK30981.1 single-stranded DNA-binding protein [Oscillatoriales cyanobacterium M4454_W2019_049]HIK50849.1 single-stranded DNA-binding protein [Oscillatoriales cyanobacterium M59_W2019_021]